MSKSYLRMNVGWTSPVYTFYICIQKGNDTQKDAVCTSASTWEIFYYWNDCYTD